MHEETLTTLRLAVTSIFVGGGCTDTTRPIMDVSTDSEDRPKDPERWADLCSTPVTAATKVLRRTPVEVHSGAGHNISTMPGHGSFSGGHSTGKSLLFFIF